MVGTAFYLTRGPDGVTNRDFMSWEVSGTVPKGVKPRSRGFYYLTTLQRIATDEGYIARIEQLKTTRRQKGKKQVYYNVNKGVR